MYSQSIRPAPRRSAGVRQASNAEKRQLRREQARLVQLLVCLALFLAVFVGKGVFPERVQEAGERLLALIRENTDFRGAFAELGQSLAERESVLGELGEFCVEVFGPAREENRPAEEIRLPPETQAEQEREFLNSNPGQAALAAHYLRLSLPPERQAEGENPKESPAAQPEPEPEPALAVGEVVEAVAYDGPELPEHYTMDRLSLGGLETVTPVLGPIWSAYGYRDHPIDGDYRFHSGVDIGANYGDSIAAFAAGTVEFTGKSEAYGNYLQIDHGQGVKSLYAHCSTVEVGQGQQVAAGETVARVGSTGNATGPHLHLELKCGGVHINPAYYIQYKSS